MHDLVMKSNYVTNYLGFHSDAWSRVEQSYPDSKNRKSKGSKKEGREPICRAQGAHRGGSEACEETIYGSVFHPLNSHWSQRPSPNLIIEAQIKFKGGFWGVERGEATQYAVCVLHVCCLLSAPSKLRIKVKDVEKGKGRWIYVFQVRFADAICWKRSMGEKDTEFFLFFLRRGTKWREAS